MYTSSFAQSEMLHVSSIEDFELDGKGSHKNWQQTNWNSLTQRRGKNLNHKTTVKTLYSEKGIYFLFRNEDSKISASFQEDFADLWLEDVVEVFLWTDEAYPFYFEYELSPLNYELAILVPNVEGKFLGWRPWNYEGERKTRHLTSIEKENDKIVSWTAEFFIPYALLSPMSHVPPEKGTKWRVNMYRLDYDNGVSNWSWDKYDRNFHDYENFGTFLFD